MAVTLCTFYPALDLDMPFSLVAFIRWPITYIKTWLIYFFLDILATGPMPRHISFVMDGNRRYAKRLGKAGKDGHPDGFKNLLWVRICCTRKTTHALMHARIQVLELCLRLRIHCVTVYAFAIENFNRPKEEVDMLMKLAEERLVEIAQRGYARVLFVFVEFRSCFRGKVRYSIDMVYA